MHPKTPTKPKRRKRCTQEQNTQRGRNVSTFISSFEISWSQEIFKMHLRNKKYQIINHTTVRISSNSMVRNSSSSLEAWYRYESCLSSQFSFRSDSTSSLLWCSAAFHKRWRQKFLELSQRAGRLSKNVSWSTASIPAIQNRGRALLWDSKPSRVDWERGTLQSCSPSEDREILMPLDKEFTLFCKSWTWGDNWLTAERSLVCCKVNSSLLACLARSVSSQQIHRKSSFWQLLVLHRSWNFSLWAWSAHWFAWYSWNLWCASSRWVT